MKDVWVFAFISFKIMTRVLNILQRWPMDFIFLKCQYKFFNVSTLEMLKSSAVFILSLLKLCQFCLPVDNWNWVWKLFAMPSIIWNLACFPVWQNDSGYYSIFSTSDLESAISLESPIPINRKWYLETTVWALVVQIFHWVSLSSYTFSVNRTVTFFMNFIPCISIQIS